MRIIPLLFAILTLPFHGPRAEASATPQGSGNPDRGEQPPALLRHPQNGKNVPAKAVEALKDKDVVEAAVRMEPAPKNGSFHSIAPLAGYDPTYGAFIGAGYFSKRVEDGKDQSNWGLAGIVAQKHGATQLEWKGQRRISNWWQVEWRNEFANGFESNYGLGNETKVEDRIDVPLWKDETDLYFVYHVSDRFSVGSGLEHRARHNRKMVPFDYYREKNPIEEQEFTGALGFVQRFDFRNNPDNPSTGWQQELKILRVQPYGGSILKAFTSVELQISTFEYLVARDLVLASSVSAGITFGQPTFLNEFRIGGSHKLRGFYHNRFRGSKYYVQQSELRFPLYKIVSGTTFLEFGEATDQSFNRPHMGSGGGLLIGLPPDNVSKIRIDYALSADQRGITVDFGHAF